MCLLVCFLINHLVLKRRVVMEVCDVTQYNLELKNAGSKHRSYYSVTEWRNGEGWDISIDCGSDKTMFGLHREDWSALNYIMAKHDISWREEESDD